MASGRWQSCLLSHGTIFLAAIYDSRTIPTRNRLLLKLKVHVEAPRA
jgi:hypothetical protein